MSKTPLDESKKKIGEYTHGLNTTKVYKLSGEHNEGDPYVVHLHKDGKHYEPADYFTNDEEDAHGTAKHMVKESENISEDFRVAYSNGQAAKRNAKPGTRIKNPHDAGTKEHTFYSQGWKDEKYSGSFEREMKESHSVKELISELHKETLKSYVKKAMNPSSEKSVSNLASKGGFSHAEHLAGNSDDDGAKDDSKAYLRSKGVMRAVDKISKKNESVADLLENISKQRDAFRSKDEPKTTYHAFTANGESAVHMYRADSSGGEIHTVKYANHKLAKEAAKKLAEDPKERAKFSSTEHNDDLMDKHREAGVF